MLLIHCPYCEEDRPELEFRHAGQAHVVRPTSIADISDDAFEDYFFIRENPKGLIYERWRHMHGCARFFNAVRNTITDKFVMTYKAGLPKPQIGGAAARKAAPAAYANVEPARLNQRRPATKNSVAKKKSAGAKKS